MRRAPTLAVLSLLILVPSPPAGAATGPEVDAPSEDRIGARIDDGGGASGPTAPVAGSRPARARRRARAGPVARPVRSVPSPALRLVDGAPCLAVVRVPGDPSSLGAAIDEARILQLRARYRRCPPSSTGRRARAPAPAASGAEPVVRAWAAELALPAPQLRVAPGSAIVGKAAYLEIAGPAHLRWQVDALGWALDVEAAATYTVDWGDGAVEEGVTSQGGPWPAGDLRHAYGAPGVHTLTVTEHWTATWTGVGHGEAAGGVLAGVLRTTATLDLPVVELQAVRLR